MSTEYISSSDAELVQDWRLSKMGYAFDVNSDVWEIDGSIRLHLAWLSVLPKCEIRTGLRQALSRYAEEYSGSTLRNIGHELSAYFGSATEVEFSTDSLLNFMNSDAGSAHKMSKLRPFLISYSEWGFPGVSEAIIEFLEELTLEGNVKGAAVRSRCPISGPLTKIEQGSLIDWASNAFNDEVITLAQFSWLMALVFTGRRGVQIRSLRGRDLVAREDGSGNDYVLCVPRAKQRGGGFRMEFRSIPIEEDLYLLLENLAKQVRDSVEEKLGERIPESLAKELPIFVEESRLKAIDDVRKLENWIETKPDYLHLSSYMAIEMLHKIAIKSQAKSERTGDYINLASRRFRQTKATNLANRGISGVALGYALDHGDTQQLDYYTKNTAKSAEYIDEIMSCVLAPLAQAFCGQLVSSERHAIRSDDPHSRVRNSVSNGIGSCGTQGFCASGCRACYTCTNFQPWRDAPHHEVRDEILAERERQKSLGISPSVIGSTDRLLLAVEEVIRLCGDMTSDEEIVHG